MRERVLWFSLSGPEDCKIVTVTTASLPHLPFMPPAGYDSLAPLSLFVIKTLP